VKRLVLFRAVDSKIFRKHNYRRQGGSFLKILNKVLFLLAGRDGKVLPARFLSLCR
jgi:hypothetical protein